MAAPYFTKKIPMQIINEKAAYAPFDLKQFLENADVASIRLSATLKNGNGLPKGLICTPDGILTGIPAKGTHGNHEILLTAENEDGQAETTFTMIIKPIPSGDANYLDQLKKQVWEALEQHLPIPDLTELYNRPITHLDIQHLLERWGIITIWDAFNLDPPGEKHLLTTLSGVSQYYNVYDRGCCLIGCPKDLFSSERTTQDGIMTAQAMAQEVYNRHWTIEMAGFYKFTRAVWAELQRLGDVHGRKVEIINYTPSTKDLNLYHKQIDQLAKKGFDNLG